MALLDSNVLKLAPDTGTPAYRSAPHNIEAEQALLGAILVNNDAFYRVSGRQTTRSNWKTPNGENGLDSWNITDGGFRVDWNASKADSFTFDGGAYRALVRARWDEARRRGATSLVVQASAMSRPVLERSGFRAVGNVRMLADRPT